MEYTSGFVVSHGLTQYISEFCLIQCQASSSFCISKFYLEYAFSKKLILLLKTAFYISRGH